MIEDIENTERSKQSAKPIQKKKSSMFTDDEGLPNIKPERPPSSSLKKSIIDSNMNTIDVNIYKKDDSNQV